MNTFDYKNLAKVEDLFFDKCAPFGFRHGNTFFQRIGDAIRFIMQQKEHSIMQYIDDLIGMAFQVKLKNLTDYAKFSLNWVLQSAVKSLYLLTQQSHA